MLALFKHLLCTLLPLFLFWSTFYAVDFPSTSTNHYRGHKWGETTAWQEKLKTIFSLDRKRATLKIERYNRAKLACKNNYHEHCHLVVTGENKSNFGLNRSQSQRKLAQNLKFKEEKTQTTQFSPKIALPYPKPWSPWATSAPGI